MGARDFKRIVVCCDGTWQHPEKSPVTNVVHTARAVLPEDAAGVHQIVFYDWGLGSEGSPVREGAFGLGIDRNIQDAYRFLVHNYAPGDDIYLFGFSRGAYTVRSLAGLMRKAGLLRKRHAKHIRAAYALYRGDEQPDLPAAREFREAHSHLLPGTSRGLVPVTFVGVWDTVGALGVPVKILRKMSRHLRRLMQRPPRYAFHDTSPSEVIRHACHAIAIDEWRATFEPTLWTQPEAGDEQCIEQRWFTGVHGDIGGGFGEEESGLSDIPLAWMWERAASHGLAFDAGYRAQYVRPDPLAALHRPWWGWRRGPARSIGVHAGASESLDDAILWRCLQLEDGYRPPNLARYLKAHPELDPLAPGNESLRQRLRQRFGTGAETRRASRADGEPAAPAGDGHAAMEANGAQDGGVAGMRGDASANEGAARP